MRGYGGVGEQWDLHHGPHNLSAFLDKAIEKNLTVTQLATHIIDDWLPHFHDSKHVDVNSRTYQVGFEAGYEDGYDEGTLDSDAEGRYEDGHNEGYRDGWDDAKEKFSNDLPNV